MSNLTIQGVVDLVRETLREVSDDTNYTDKYIYRLILQARSTLLNQMKDQNKGYSPWLYQRFCLKLCPSSFIECQCSPFSFACNVYRSTTPLPQPIGDDNMVLNVSELWGDKINRITENQFRTIGNRKYKVPYYYYVGNYDNDYYLFILGNSTVPPKYIKVEGIFDDPSEVSASAACDEDCPQMMGIGFPFQLDKESAMIKMVVELLMVSKKLPEDLTNNAESTVPTQII